MSVDTHHDTTSGQQTTAWQGVAEQLLNMLRMLESDASRPVNLAKFAEGYAELSRMYLHAIEGEGRTSMRAEAVVKALDLHTPKSKLLTFLERQPVQGE